MTITSAHVRDGKVTLLFICILYCLQAVAVSAVGAINRKVTSENNIQLSDYKDRGEGGRQNNFLLMEYHYNILYRTLKTLTFP